LVNKFEEGEKLFLEKYLLLILLGSTLLPLILLLVSVPIWSVEDVEITLDEGWDAELLEEY
jgi:hypothetical protein